jgi:alpha-aminoadipate/glutamate carrier protein LysW
VTDRVEECMATCPECDAEIEVDEFDVDKGDQLSCPECGSNLEVIGLAPLQLDLVLDDDDEDLDDDAEGDDDDDESDEDDEDDEDFEE